MKINDVILPHAVKVVDEQDVLDRLVLGYRMVAGFIEAYGAKRLGVRNAIRMFGV